MRTGRVGRPSGGRFAKWFAVNLTPLAFVASALGCSLAVNPRSTQCDSDRQCAALVENGQKARCAAGYCQLLGGGASVSGAAGTLDAGRGQAGRSGGAGSPSFGGGAGATAGTDSESPGTGETAGGSTGLGAVGGSTGTGGVAAGASLGGTAGSSVGGSEGAPAAPVSDGDGDGTEAGGGAMGGGAGVSFDGSAGQASSGDGASDGGSGGSEASTTAQGVMMLTVPLAAPGQGQRYNAHNTGRVESSNLAGATLTLRVYAPGATGGNLHVFCTSSNLADGAATDIALSSLTEGFQDIDIPVPAPVPGGFEPTRVFIIRVEVEAGPGFGDSWRSPATVIYIDSIISSNGVISEAFDTAPSFRTFGSADVRAVPNSTLAWLPSIPLP
jgi:hypothetical protein